MGEETGGEVTHWPGLLPLHLLFWKVDLGATVGLKHG